MREELAIRANFLQEVFGSGIINGESIALTCPQCSKDRPDKKKLIVRLADGMHHCWICGLKGKTLKYTIRKFASEKIEKYSRLFESSEKIEVQEDKQEEVRIPKGFVLLAQNLNTRDPDIKATIEYAYARGLTKKDLWYFKLGTCKFGSFRRRLIIPSFDSLGKLNYYTGRSIDDNGARKYLNAKAKKKDLIFNEINIDWSEPLTLVEGPFDLTKCNYNATTLLGSFLNEGYVLFQKIVKNSTPVILVLDSDAKMKQQKISRLLYSYGVQVKILDMEADRDVGDMSKEQFLKLKESAKIWLPNDILKYRISSIKSGSLI